MKPRHFLAAATVFATGIVSVQFALAQTASQDSPGISGLNKKDTNRLVAIAQANLAEVAAGKMASEKSTNPAVKTFAQMMIEDHSKGLDETKKVAEAKNVTLPTEPDSEHKKIATELSKLSGSVFDKEYVSKAGVADHTKVLAALKEDIANAQDPDVKALASKLEPTVAHHEDMAKKLNSAMK